MFKNPRLIPQVKDQGKIKNIINRQIATTLKMIKYNKLCVHFLLTTVKLENKFNLEMQ